MSSAAAGTAGVAAAGGGAGPAPAAAAAAPPAAAAAAAAAAASAAAAAAASGAPVGSVFVKRAGDPHARFARVEIYAGDAVTDLAERASLKRGWAVDAAFVDLFVVKPAGDKDAFVTPTQKQIDAVLADDGNVLGEAMPLSLAGIASGAWVVARLTGPPAAAPGEYARTRARARLAASILVGLSSGGPPEGLARRVVQGGDSAGVIAYGALTLSALAGPFIVSSQAAAAVVERARLLVLKWPWVRHCSGPPTGFARRLSRRASPLTSPLCGA